MYALLCTLSDKRRALLDEDGTLVVDLVQARRSEPIPGMLEIGKAWDALDVILNGGREGDGLLGDAILARSGRAIGPALAYGRAKLLEPARVKEIADALDALPESLVRDRYPLLKAHGVHGGYGTTEGEVSPEVEELLEEEGFTDDDIDEEEAAELELALDDLRKHYRKAADAGHGMLAAIT